MKAAAVSREPARGAGAAERGSGLIAMVFLTLALAGVGMAYLAVLPFALRANRERLAEVKARYWAIGALARSRASLSDGGTGNIDGNAVSGTARDVGSGSGSGSGAGLPVTGGQPFATLRDGADGAFRTRTQALPDGTHLVESAAIMGGVLRHVAQVFRTERSPYQGVLFANTGISATSTYGIPARILCDSYNARSADPYAVQRRYTEGEGEATYRYAGDAGSIRSDEWVVLGEGAVFGNAQPGPGGGYSASPDIYVRGTTSPTDETLNLQTASFTIPAVNDNDTAGSFLNYPNAYLNFNYGSRGEVIDIVGGTYVLDFFFAWYFTAELRITGDVTLYLNESSPMSSFTKITVAEGGSLKVFAGDASSVFLGGYGIVNETGLPENVRFYLGSNSQFTLDAAFPFAGVVYGPESLITLRDCSLFGAVVGDEIVLDTLATGGTSFTHDLHFDTSLLDLEDEAPRIPRSENVATWWLTR